MKLVEARGVAVRLGGARVLDRLDLAVADGELVGLIGPNGAGKTTLLKTLAGLAAPERGRVLLRGESLAGMDRFRRARTIAYLAQDGRPNWPVDVRTLVGLGRLPHLRPWRGPGAADREAVARAMAECRIAALADRPATELSGGERARVLLARALAGDPGLLLADEPTAGLDPAHQLDAMALLAGLAQAGRAVVAVLHDLTLAARYCTRLALLHQGRILADGRERDVLTPDLLARCYGIAVHRGAAGGAPFVIPVGRAGAAEPDGGR